MKKENDVFIKFPWRFQDSPYHKYLLNNTPTGINYINKIPKLENKTQKRKTLIKFKEFLSYLRKILSVPNLVYSKKNADLLHCAHCLNLSNKSWVVDLENYDSFGQGASKTKIGKSIIKKILKKEQCKKILPWTKKAKEKIEKNIKDKRIRDKIEVLYPAIPQQKRKAKKDGEIRILYISRYFYEKGGLIALEVFRRLKGKYDLETVFISNVPKKLRKKYSEINIKGLVPQEDLFSHYYPKSDIFIYPTLWDTFGFAMLEAYSFGIPVITVEGFSRREIVENGKTGYVVPRPEKPNFYKITEKEEKIIKNIFKKTSFLIENPKTRKKMRKKARKLIETGKFSLKKRNKKLKKIYLEAIK